MPFTWRTSWPTVGKRHSELACNRTIELASFFQIQHVSRSQRGRGALWVTGLIRAAGPPHCKRLALSDVTHRFGAVWHCAHTPLARTQKRTRVTAAPIYDDSRGALRSLVTLLGRDVTWTWRNSLKLGWLSKEGVFFCSVSRAHIETCKHRAWRLQAESCKNGMQSLNLSVQFRLIFF